MDTICPTETFKFDSDYCETHKILNLKCNTCGKTLCKYCVFTSKSDANHFAQHFDALSDYIKSDMYYASDSRLNRNENFKELNKFFPEFVSKSNRRLNFIFDNILIARDNISEQINNTYLEQYNKIVDEVTELNKKLNQSRGEEAKNIQNKISNLLSNYKNEFENTLNKFEERFNKLKAKELRHGQYNFNSSFKTNNTWNNNSNRLTTSKKEAPYWIAKSNEIIEGSFMAKVRVVNIDKDNGNNHWNFTFGMQKSENKDTDDTYYTSSVILQSNGWTNNEYTSSGINKQILDRWRIDDILIIFRDELNNVFFGINDDTQLKHAFSNIVGSFRLIMGFRGNMNGDIFDLIEFIKY